MLYLRQSTASQSVKLGPFVDSTDGATAETGLTIANTDIQLSKAGGTMASKNSGGGTHDANGWYTITLDATDTATIGSLQVSCKVAGALAVWAEFQVVEEAIYDSLFASSAGTLATAAALATAQTDLDTITGSDGVTLATAQALYAPAKAGDSMALTAAAVDAVWDEPTAGHVTAGTTGVALTDILADTNELQTDDTPGAIAALNDPTAAAIADAVWDEAIAGHLGAGSTGAALNGASAPTAAAVADAVWDEAISGHLGAGSTGEALNAAGAAGDPWTTSLPGAYTGSQAGKMLSDILTDTGTTLDGKLNTAQADLDTLTGTNGVTLATSQPNYAPNTTTPPTAAAIADAVWDEATSGHVTAGSTAVALTDILTDTSTTLDGKLNTAQADLDTITGSDGVTLATSQSLYAPAKAGDSMALTAAAVDAVWDEVITGAAHNVNTSAAKFLREASASVGMLSGTAQSATSTTLVLASGAVTANDILNGERVSIIDGTGVGQSRIIVDSVASTDTVTIANPWITNPDATSIYSIVGAECDVQLLDGQMAVATATVDFDDIAAILTDTNELQTDDIPGAIAALNDPTAAAIADAVWDEATSGHVSAGTTGKAVVDILADTNELQTDDYPTTLATLATAAALATVDTNVDAILVDTAEIGVAGAGLTEAGGTGDHLTAIPTLTTQMTEAYAANGVAPTAAQALFAIHQMLMGFAIAGTTISVKKLDGATQAFAVTLDDGTTPTSALRS